MVRFCPTPIDGYLVCSIACLITILTPFVSPRALAPLKLTNADEIKAAQSVAREPVVRQPFPEPVQDRSLLFGASNKTFLRTCFRLGEALNVGSEAVRTKQDLVIELYARVTSSHREKRGARQHFVFRDLYHDHAPHLDGTFELCQQSRLWNLDSKVFLTPRRDGIMCRAIAKMKQDIEKKKWRLEVLSIWEATWEDVDYVAGIYATDLTSAVKEA